MLIINRLIPVLSPVLIFIGLQYLIIKPHQLFWLSPLILLIFLAGLWQLTGRNLKIEKFWRYLITPFFFLFFGIIFLILSAHSTTMILFLSLTNSRQPISANSSGLDNL